MCFTFSSSETLKLRWTGGEGEEMLLCLYQKRDSSPEVTLNCTEFFLTYKLAKVLLSSFSFPEEAHQCGKGLLIHCQAGVSRSATIVIAYLMKHTRMTMTDAYKFVKGKRPIISPNLNFMGQLLEFEEDLNNGVTPRILTPKLIGVETVVWWWSCGEAVNEGVNLFFTWFGAVMGGLWVFLFSFQGGFCGKLFVNKNLFL